MSKIILNVVAIYGQAVTSYQKEFDTDFVEAVNTFTPSSDSRGLSSANAVVAYKEHMKSYAGVAGGSTSYVNRNLGKGIPRPVLYYVVENAAAVVGGYTLKEVVDHTWAGGVALTDTVTTVYPVSDTDMFLVKQNTGTIGASLGAKSGANEVTITLAANGTNGNTYQVLIFNKE